MEVDLTVSPEQNRAERCPVCGLELAVHEIAAHCEAHFLAEDAECSAVTCPTCKAAVSLEDIESHELAHSLDQSDGTQQDVAEAEQLEDLRQRYGFDARPRPGSCHLCGEAGHWVPECPSNPDKIASLTRMVSPPARGAITTAQRPDPQWRGDEAAHLVEAMAACLREQLSGAQRVTTLLCAPVRHFGGQRHDAGWGCGYRNTQMQISSLLAARDDVRAALCGACGFVPDIPSLQAWVECAWRDGFDPEGAEQLGRKLQAERKWIGTTEAAALLRYFGVQATIVDFGVASAAAAGASRLPAAPWATGGGPGGTGQPGRGAGGKGKSGSSAAPGGGVQEVHLGVECNGCGAVGFAGPLYRSEVLADFDLCAACRQLSCHQAAAPFRRMLPSAHTSGAAAGSTGEGEGSSAGRAVVDWVWRYFSAGEEATNGNVAEGGMGPSSPGVPPPAGKRPRQGVAASAPPPGVILTGQLPLYFQHEGHSRSIVGIERRESIGRSGKRVEHTLLVLDPAVAPAALAASLRSRQGWQQLLKRGVRTLRHQQYQLLYCPLLPPLSPGTKQYHLLKRIAAAERYA